MFSKKLLATSVSAVTLALAGCGASDQDSGTSGSNVQLSGLVVDPYISGATVYVDLNNNGIRDSVLEAKAQTDKDGYFSKSKDGVDYCADKQYERFCLRTPITASGAVLRIEGGYDVASGQPFKGSLVMPLDLNGQAQEVDAVNPLISLFASSTTEEQQSSILTFIGGTTSLTEDDLNKDFLSKNPSGGAGVDPEMFRRAMQVHKAVAIISAALENHYSIEPGKEKDGKKLPGNAGKYAYDAVAKLLAVTQTPSAKDDPATEAIDSWFEALTSAETSVRDALGSSLAVMSDAEKEAIGERVAKLFDWFETDETIPANATAEDLFKRSRVADFAVGQVTREIKSSGGAAATPLEDSVMGSAITIISGKTNSNFTVDTFSNETNLDEMISSTAKVTDTTTVPEIGTEAALFTTADPVAGQTLDMSYTESSTKNGQVKVFFNGASGATSGTAALCVKAVGYDTDVKGLDEGQYVPGYWAKLNDYAFTLKFDLSGVPDQPLIVKRTAVDTNGDTFQFSLESTGQLESWTGTLTDTSGTIPANNSACQAKFGS